MSTHLKTQLSLILLAVVITAGLVSFFFRSVHKDFALFNSHEQFAEIPKSTPAEPGIPAENGAVLGASDNASANPLQGIYVNPFGQ